ncbi:zinc metallopeptidase [Chloropicon primus]|uniref:Zinc metallopeptidase n=2 Tax=Chloropicon primus TaxID=1764295 RepID=A0A5B8MDS3_9CHLO|nr:zinc metallopeptidase [Chloropicon primus]UPQ97788.1 zinc metallopeptidase [Chloropicon primus]|eukprot:QDZ18579.1 zinc metallopeptidase [Chloropicon primus]
MNAHHSGRCLRPGVVFALALALALLVPIAMGADDGALGVHYEYQVEVPSNQRETLEKALGIVSRWLGENLQVKRPEGTASLFLEPQCTRFVTWSGAVNRKECLDYSLSSCGKAEVNPQLYRPREVCDPTRPRNCETVGRGNPGAPAGAQLVVYVTSSPSPGCSQGDEVGELASAVYCTRSSVDDRPTSGNVNICPETLQKAASSERELYRLADTLLHEHFHLLGFNPGLFPDFVGEDGSRIGEDKVVRRQEGGQTSIITPRVVAAARQHFGCDTLDAVPLERSGGTGTAGGHWPADLFGDREIMVPTIALTRAVVSDMTLALIEDSGWYRSLKNSSLGYLSFNRDVGCLAGNGFCDAEASSEYYCKDDGRASFCSPDHYSVGACERATDAQCSMVKSFGNMICRDEAADAQSTLGYDPKDWAQRYGESSRCLPIASEPYEWRNDVNQFSYTLMGLGGSGGCFNVRCDRSRGTEDLRIMVRGPDGQETECREGGYVDAKALSNGLQSGKIGPCPSAKAFCSNLGCPSDCSARGDCFNPNGEAECRCYLGFKGESCNNLMEETDTVFPAGARNVTASAPTAPPLEMDAMASEEPQDSGIEEAESGGANIPWKVVAVGCVVLVGALALVITFWLIARRFKSTPRGRGRGRGGGTQMQHLSLSETAEAPEESNDLDGGIVGVHAHRLLYGTSIKVDV